jgi:hypothetical protein
LLGRQTFWFTFVLVVDASDIIFEVFISHFFVLEYRLAAYAENRTFVGTEKMFSGQELVRVGSKPWKYARTLP